MQGDCYWFALLMVLQHDNAYHAIAQTAAEVLYAVVTCSVEPLNVYTCHCSVSSALSSFTRLPKIAQQPYVLHSPVQQT